MEIVYQDRRIVVAVKPSGVLSTDEPGGAPELLRALADSLLHQSCGAWEACFYDGASTRADTRELLQTLTQEDNRFRVTIGTENRGIAGNTNAALTMATGEFVALCDHDDLLAPDAVRCILEAAQDGADFVYTDEDKVSADGTHFGVSFAC